MSVSNDKTRLFLSSGYSLKVLQQHIKNENSHASEITNCPILESKPKHVRKSMNIINQINNHLNSKNYMMVSRNRPKRLSSDTQIKRPEIKRYMPPAKRSDISLNSNTSACESIASEANINDFSDGSSMNSPTSHKNYLQNHIVDNDKRCNEQLVNKNPKAILIIKDKKIVREYQDNCLLHEELPTSNTLSNNISQKNYPLTTSEDQTSVPIVSQTNESNLTSPTSTIPTMLLVKDALNREKRITLAPQQSPTKSSSTKHDQWHNIYIPPGARRSLSFSEENNSKPNNPPNTIYPPTHLNPSSYNTELNGLNRLYDPFRDLIRLNQPCMLPPNNGYNADPSRRTISPIGYSQNEHERSYNASYYLTPPQYPLQNHAFDGYGPLTTNYLSREPPRNYAAFYDNSLDQQQPQAEYSPSKSGQRGDVRILKKEVNNLLGDLRIGDNVGGSNVGGGKRSRVNSTKTAENSWSQYFGEEDITDKLNRVIEVSGFPIEFKTVDLTNILTNTGDAEMDILWVDDDHALAVFTSAYFASEALKLNHPLIKCKPYEQACAKSKAKGQKNLDFVFNNMTSNRTRPLTTVVVARRFIENHLGVKCNVSSETRLKEAHTLKEAAALGKKKIAAEKKKIDPWDE